MHEEIPVPVRQAETEGQRREEFGELARRFEDAALRWAYSVLGDSALAQDAVQEAYIIAYLHMNQLRDRDAFAGWFKQIVLTACTRLIRRRDIVTKLREQAVEERQADPSEVVEEDEGKDSVRRAVQTLPEHERVVAEMFYFLDYPQEEISRVLDVPVTTVKKRLQYARERLRRTLGENTPTMLLGDDIELPTLELPDQALLAELFGIAILDDQSAYPYPFAVPGSFLPVREDILTCAY